MTHEIFADTLAVMRGNMERDDDRGNLFDAAERDFMDEARWQMADAQEEREANLEAALDEAKEKGVSLVSLKVLAMEGGATKWALKQSLAVEPQRQRSWFSDEQF